MDSFFRADLRVTSCAGHTSSLPTVVFILSSRAQPTVTQPQDGPRHAVCSQFMMNRMRYLRDVGGKVEEVDIERYLFVCRAPDPRQTSRVDHATDRLVFEEPRGSRPTPRISRRGCLVAAQVTRTFSAHRPLGLSPSSNSTD